MERHTTHGQGLLPHMSRPPCTSTGVCHFLCVATDRAARTAVNISPEAPVHDTTPGRSGSCAREPRSQRLYAVASRHTPTPKSGTRERPSAPVRRTRSSRLGERSCTRPIAMPPPLLPVVRDCTMRRALALQACAEYSVSQRQQQRTRRVVGVGATHGQPRDRVGDPCWEERVEIPHPKRARHHRPHGCPVNDAWGRTARRREAKYVAGGQPACGGSIPDEVARQLACIL